MRTLAHVDDDRFTRQMVSYVFEDTDMDLISHSCAQACLDMLLTVKPDAILLDANLDDMDGAQLSGKLNVEHPDIPIVFISASSEKEIFKDHDRTPNVVGVVKKPFIPEELLLQIESALDKNFIASVVTASDDDAIDELRKDYIRHLSTLVGTIQALWQKVLRDADNTDALTQLTKLLHKINGTSGLYRLGSVQAIAEALEDDFIALSKLSKDDLDKKVLKCAPSIERLLDAINKLSVG